MEKFAWISRRNFRGERNVSTALALVQDPRTAAEFVGDVLTVAYGPLKGTTKHIARVANSNERSAENWLQKRVCPNVPKFLRLAMEVPELNAAVIWLMQNGPGHPEAQKKIAAMEAYLAMRPEAGDCAVNDFDYEGDECRRRKCQHTQIRWLRPVIPRN